eukprot:scaffold39859_cov130-Amphora_coffeaeformis.AAC.1
MDVRHRRVPLPPPTKGGGATPSTKAARDKTVPTQRSITKHNRRDHGVQVKEAKEADASD